jgi:hypothetical protein
MAPSSIAMRSASAPEAVASAPESTNGLAEAAIRWQSRQQLPSLVEAPSSAAAGDLETASHAPIRSNGAPTPTPTPTPPPPPPPPEAARALQRRLSAPENSTLRVERTTERPCAWRGGRAAGRPMPLGSGAAGADACAVTDASGS